MIMTSAKVDIIWSPNHSDRFVTVGNDLRLYQVLDEKEENDKNSGIQLSEKTKATLLAINSDHQYMKCLSWYPKPDPPHLLAIGQANGKVTLTGFGQSTDSKELTGQEFGSKHSRQCNCVSWNPVEHSLLAAGLEKNRADYAILVWDILKSYRSSSKEYVAGSEKLLTGTTVELGLSESAHSLQWFLHQPKTLVCGMNNKQLKIYDLRDCSKHQNSSPTKAVLGLCVDPFYEHRFASYVESQVMIWDLRNFEKPVVTLNESRPIVKLAWSPKRCNLLATLNKDSSVLKLYDIQQAPIGSDDIEPMVVERIIRPYDQHFVGSFSWHPEHENRMLVITPNCLIRNYVFFDRITLNWAPTSELVWTHGKKLLQCIDDRDRLFEALEDISIKMRQRALMDYGLKTHHLWENGEVVSDELQLQRLWNLLDLVKSLNEEGQLVKAPPGGGNGSANKYEGVKELLTNGNTKSEPVKTRRQAVIGLDPSHFTIYQSEERDRASRLCGWGSENHPGIYLENFLDRLVLEGHNSRAAAIFTFNFRLRHAIQVLSRAKPDQNADGNLNVVAMALSGYTEEHRTLWREMCQTLRPKLHDPYLRAMFAFLTSENNSYDDVLSETGMAIEDRVAFAIMFLTDTKLTEFIECLTSKMVELGDLDGILLTGLNSEGLDLIQSYVDKTGDVQTASLVVLQAQSAAISENSKAKMWVDSYRGLLDSWRLWKQRAQFDVQWYKCNPTMWPPQQVFVSCNFCGKSVSSHLQMMGQAHGPRNYARLGMSAANKSKVTSCPGCRKPLPRCSLCLTNMGTPSGTHRSFERDNEADEKRVNRLTKFSSWFTWCQMCRHGGHATHLLEWFKEHSKCPVTACNCKCMSLDFNT